MNNQEKGFSAIIIVILVVILGIGAYLYMNKTEDYMMEDKSSDAMMEDDDAMHTQDGAFKDMDEPEGTPEEVSNDSIEEMDKLMLEIDASVEGEDLSDL